jgi:predicted alpha/beta superfamily hydrolase
LKGLLLYFSLLFTQEIAAQNNNSSSTATAQVSIIDTSFYMPQLNRNRRILIYLPKDYLASNKRYPVMYLQDGQNVFDAATSFAGEWGVDECLDSLYTQKQMAVIVVAIDNGSNYRMTEYNPYDNEQFGKAEGEAYVNFLANTLKPFIDSAYRTLPTASNTIIAGSSMGGLIAYYAAITKPKIFGKAGVFSPSFWIAPQLKLLTDSIGKKLDSKLFFTMGSTEGDKYIDDMNAIAEQLGLVSNSMILLTIAENENHNEANWRKQFPIFCKWILGDGYNVIIE